MVMGIKPYAEAGLSVVEIQMKIVGDKLPLTQTKWDSIIQQAIEKSLDRRFATTQEMKVAFEELFFNQEKPISKSNSKQPLVKDGPALDKTTVSMDTSEVDHEKTVLSAPVSIPPTENQVKATYDIKNKNIANSDSPLINTSRTADNGINNSPGIYISVTLLVAALTFSFHYQLLRINSYQDYPAADTETSIEDNSDLEFPAPEDSITYVTMEAAVDSGNVDGLALYFTVCPYCESQFYLDNYNIDWNCQNCFKTFYSCKQNNSETYGLKSEWKLDGEWDCADCSDE